MTSATIIVAAGVLYRSTAAGERVLLTQRKSGTHLEGHWELPGGKVLDGEDPRQAVARELREEIGVDVDVLDPIEITAFSYPTKHVLLLFFEVAMRPSSAEPTVIDVAALRWADADAIDTLTMPPADVAVAKKIQARLRASAR